MRRTVESNHVPVGSTRARRCLVDLHPVYRFRYVALPAGTWCAARLPESPRADRSVVTSPPCAVCVARAVDARLLPPEQPFYRLLQLTLS